MMVAKEAEIRPKEVDSASTSQSPKIPYRVALSSWFFLPDGTCHQVGTCNTSFLYDLVELCTPAWPAEKQDRLMQEIDEDDEQPGRWHVINVLRESKGVYAPLFATMGEAAAMYAFLIWCKSLPLLFQNRFSEPIEACSQEYMTCKHHDVLYSLQTKKRPRTVNKIAGVKIERTRK